MTYKQKNYLSTCWPIMFGLIVILVGSVWLGRTAQAGRIVLSHSDDNDPRTEGWLRTMTGYPGAIGYAVDDDGTPAWFTRDNTAASAAMYYDGASALTAQDLTDMASGGFSMRATLKVDDFIASGYDEADSLAPGMQLSFTNLNFWCGLALGSNDDGDTTWQLSGIRSGESSTGVVSGSGYNDYELLYDPTNDKVDLLINGNEVVTDLSAYSATAGKNRLYWGLVDTAGKGAGYWTDVQFETAPVPEPSTLMLLCTGLVGLLAYAGRKRK